MELGRIDQKNCVVEIYPTTSGRWVEKLLLICCTWFMTSTRCTWFIISVILRTVDSVRGKNPIGLKVLCVFSGKWLMSPESRGLEYEFKSRQSDLTTSILSSILLILFFPVFLFLVSFSLLVLSFGKQHQLLTHTLKPRSWSYNPASVWASSRKVPTVSWVSVNFSFIRKKLWRENSRREA